MLLLIIRDVSGLKHHKLPVTFHRNRVSRTLMHQQRLANRPIVRPFDLLGVSDKEIFFRIYFLI